MQKKVDLSTCQGHLVEVVIERADEQQPWSLAVRVREAQGSAWSEPWRDGAHHYFTCHDALAAGKQQAVRMIAPPDAAAP
ncbi:MAG: hypothetical protein QM795_16170 [Pseudoxanthomonas sp.]